MLYQNKTLCAKIMLVLAAAIWGINYSVIKSIASDIGPFSYMSLRTFWGSFTLLILILYNDFINKKTSPCEKLFLNLKNPSYFKKLFLISAFCGVINASGTTLIQFGLIYTSASKAGFLGTIYIIFVPIIGLLFFKIKTPFLTLAGIFLAIIGLYFLCVTDDFRIETGDIIILMSNICFAIHIQLLSKYVKLLNGLHLACVEFFFAGVFCLILALIFEDTSFLQVQLCFVNAIFSGVFGIGICYALQVTAQKYTDPSLSALLMSLESVFAALSGFVFLSESFSPKEFIGALFILIAIIISNKSKQEIPSQESLT